MSNDTMMASTGQTRVRRRDRFRALALATTFVIKQEVTKYVNQLTEESLAHNGNTRTIMAHDASPKCYPNVPRMRTQSFNTLDDVAAANIKPHCMLFPSYAFRDPDENGMPVWHVRLAGWTFAKATSSRLEKLVLAAGRTYSGILADSDEDAHFGKMLNQFRCQTMRSIDIQLTVTSNPSTTTTQESSSKEHTISHRLHHLKQRLHHLHSQLHDLSRNPLGTVSINSGPAGRFEHTIVLDPTTTQEDHHPHRMLWLEAQLNDMLDVSAHDGLVDMVDPTGVSVISDIDDTIKVTGISDGRDAILRNTFFSKGREVTGMSEIYRRWAGRGAHFHYVSNSPWELYPMLSEFFMEHSFPPGSMHLRSITKGSLFRKKTSRHKLDLIPQIIQDFPHRKFILVGDSAERDAEIYREIFDRFPNQVVKICIHDVTSHRARMADRRAIERNESYYGTIRKFLARDPSFNASTTMSTNALDAIGDVDVSEEQQQTLEPGVPVKTKLELFEEKMERASRGLPEGVFKLFSFAHELATDPVLCRVLAGPNDSHAMSHDHAAALWATQRHEF